MEGDADGVILKVTITDQREESMRISSFLIDRFVTGEDDKDIKIEVENLGDIAAAPAGEIIFYNSRGIEVAASPVNIEKVNINPGEKAVIKSVVPLDNDLGKYKANVNLKYGGSQAAALYDTTNFYMVPLPLLILVIGSIIVISILISFMFKRAFINDDHFDDDGDEVAMYVREGHDAEPQHHDIDLKNN